MENSIFDNMDIHLKADYVNDQMTFIKAYRKGEYRVALYRKNDFFVEVYIDLKKLETVNIQRVKRL